MICLTNSFPRANAKDGITEEEAKRLCEEIINLQQMNNNIYTRTGWGKTQLGLRNPYPNDPGYTDRRVEFIGEDGLSGILGNIMKIFTNDHDYWSKAWDELDKIIPEEDKAGVIPY